MKKNTFWKIVLLMMIFSTFSLDFVAQTIPENTRLFQLNAKKGSRLSIVENTDNFVYHIGTNNSPPRASTKVRFAGEEEKAPKTRNKSVSATIHKQPELYEF